MDILSANVDSDTPVAEIFTVRIIRDSDNKDGWICRSLSNSKVGFIKNIDETITQLSSGQLWEATMVEDRAKYAIIHLVSMIRA